MTDLKDPTLEELLHESEDPDEELEVIMRLVVAGSIPEKVKVIAQFGDVVTCRILRQDIEEVYASPLKFSMKAAKVFGIETTTAYLKKNFYQNNGNSALKAEPSIQKRTNVIVGLIDWGCDFTHLNFRNKDGTTRLLGIWDQSLTQGDGVKPYGYGTFFSANDINNALETETPFKYLHYHPAKADPTGIGAHGTHVMDIAAGNGTVGKAGIAPDAQLMFVHLSTGDTGGASTLGDSVRILEAIDFIRTISSNNPLVINMSVGRHGGPHDGNTLVERAIDNFLEERNNTMFCQSTGNYYMSNTHASGVVRAGVSSKLSFSVDEADTTPNELEIWYSGKDVFHFILKTKGINVEVSMGEKKNIYYNNQLIGRAYHRRRDPTNLKNHINIFLYPNAPKGIWNILLSGSIIVDGRFNAWIERDTGCKKCQSKFLPSYISKQVTTGTICNGYNSLVVGAYNSHSNGFNFGVFSSEGPTADGRFKPDLIAPGVKIVAAKSSFRTENFSHGDLTTMSGTSMAAPHVTGTVAKVLEIVPSGTPYHVIRNIINGSTDKVEFFDIEPARIGNGILNTKRALQSAELYAKSLTINQGNS